ncbi:MAG: hypothetical protein KBA72_00190 [Thermoanaerobaculia bacterium]|nr:hypothetical protein [Thermoanaerobaculia bacterium]
MARRSRHRDASNDGPPDPAAALDRLELWIERRLPDEPRPLWAAALVVAMRLLLGRGSWIVGTLFVALGAPWFVLVHRQVDTMVRAAWYRATATATAEARVERVELRLIDGVWDGTQRVVPSVLLSFEATGGAGSPAGGERTWVRYLPHGAGLESHHQWASSPPLLASPPAITPDWRFRWGTASTPGFDLLWTDGESTRLETAAPWNGETYLANALADLDRPIDLLVGDWTRDATDGSVLPIRFPPGNPHRIFVADALSHLPPSAGNGFAELVFSLILMVPFGLPFWWFGTRLLSRGVAPRHRHYFVWVPLALLPFWGVRYLEILERLSPGAFERNALLAKVGSTQVLPGAEPAGLGPAFDSRRRIDLASSRFAPTLTIADLARPARRLANGDAAWRELEDRFTRALGRLDDEAFARAVDQTLAAESIGGPPALAPMLAEAARLATLDPARGERAKVAARQLLNFLTYRTSVDLCHPSFRAYREDLERLALHPEPEIAGPARERLAEIASWIGARESDWGKIC